MMIQIHVLNREPDDKRESLEKFGTVRDTLQGICRRYTLDAMTLMGTCLPIESSLLPPEDRSGLIAVKVCLLAGAVKDSSHQR
jgi:hypothetical protein